MQLSSSGAMSFINPEEQVAAAEDEKEEHTGGGSKSTMLVRNCFALSNVSYAAASTSWPFSIGHGHPALFLSLSVVPVPATSCVPTGSRAAWSVLFRKGGGGFPSMRHVHGYSHDVGSRSTISVACVK